MAYSSQGSASKVSQVEDPSLKLTQFVGTPLYQSPEQIEGLPYNEKVDIFAMGLILYELCASFKTGMERRESIDLLRNEHKLKSGFREQKEVESKLILWMTNKKHSERPSAQEIVDSELFKVWKAKSTN
jgi:serine/threonine protein kinase